MSGEEEVRAGIRQIRVRLICLRLEGRERWSYRTSTRRFTLYP